MTIPLDNDQCASGVAQPGWLYITLLSSVKDYNVSGAAWCQQQSREIGTWKISEGKIHVVLEFLLMANIFDYIYTVIKFEKLVIV